MANKCTLICQDIAWHTVVSLWLAWNTTISVEEARLVSLSTVQIFPRAVWLTDILKPRGESQGDREPSQLSSAKWWGATGKMKPYYLQRCTAKDQRQWSQGAVRKFWQKKIWQGKNCSESDSAVKEVPRVMVGIPSLEFEAWLGKALSTLAWLWNWPCIEHEVRPAGPFQPQPCIPWEAENSVTPLCGETADVGHFLPLWSTLLELSLS